MLKKQVLTGVLALGLMVAAAPNAFAKGDVEFRYKPIPQLPYLSEVLEMQPDVTEEELMVDVRALAENMGETEEAVLEMIYNEMNANHEAGVMEEESVKALGSSGGTVSVGTSSKGNFFYTASYTAYLNHGHVGMYYSSGTIVESVPSTGVRTISTTNRLVDKGAAVVKSVTTTSTNKTNAANWAYSRVGIDAYSYNFANNRNTSHYGDKNCSKLIWSAYKLNGGLDLDVDGGFGVYPRDVRDAKQTAVVRNI
ncbi:YiiX/YebB-like N1pC/P60 family cysteine hydrolase [Pseudoneobacillus sp. C159]